MKRRLSITEIESLLEASTGLHANLNHDGSVTISGGGPEMTPIELRAQMATAIMAASLHVENSVSGEFSSTEGRAKWVVQQTDALLAALGMREQDGGKYGEPLHPESL